MSVTKLIIDGHVHFYDCYDPGKFFQAAIINLDAFFHSKYPEEEDFQRILLLTEGKSNNYFKQLKINGIPGSDFEVRNTQEDCSLTLFANNNPQCFILAGRQIVTQENLEILSIASNYKIEDGLPARDVIGMLLERKEITVLSWGVGKWLFKRGKIIRELIKEYHSPYLFIGDNGARPSFWPTPELFKMAEAYGIRVLSGSDPLPFSRETCRVGTFGFTIGGRIDANNPAESFRNNLLSKKGNVSFFGKQDRAHLFLKRQLEHRFTKSMSLRNMKP
ncbi:MAG: hypothetical protein GY941_24705 [Planctomycetes bacterium]|nr:hypothetical protein [Planctomycetota bacterium]